MPSEDLVQEALDALAAECKARTALGLHDAAAEQAEREITTQRQNAEDAGVPATLSIYEDMPHVFVQLTAILDGGKKAVGEACVALKNALC